MGGEVLTTTVLFCGSRDFKDREAIRKKVAELPEGTTVIHGACRGADTIAGSEAKRRGLKVVEYPADWEEHGRRAGPIRNQTMLDHGKPSKVYAFYEDKEASTGTADMVRRARQAKVPYWENK